MMMRLRCFFMSKKDLLLICRFYYMAFRSNRDIVIFSEIFFDQSYFRYFINSLSNILVSFGYSFDDIMVMTLKIFNILTLNTILNKIIMSFNAKLWISLVLLIFLVVENFRNLIIFIIVLDDSSFLLCTQ